MNNHIRLLTLSLAAALTAGLGSAAGADRNVTLSEARIFIEFNATANAARLRVVLNAENWRRLRIRNPQGHTFFESEGRAGFGSLGFTELSFEGVQPSLEEVSLDELLDLFPEGRYRFSGRTVGGDNLTGVARLSHRIPRAPVIVSPKRGETLDATERIVVDWDPVRNLGAGRIVRYQVIVGTFEVTLPPSKTRVTIPREFLEPGTEYRVQVLVIGEGGNQTISESFFRTE